MTKEELRQNYAEICKKNYSLLYDKINELDTTDLSKTLEFLVKEILITNAETTLEILTKLLELNEQ